MTSASPAEDGDRTSKFETVVIYPSMIARAITMLDEDPFLRTLPYCVWPTLVRLIKKIDVNHPQKPIFASRATLANEAQSSLQNLNRQLKTLEDMGIIERNQKARQGLRGSSSEITLTGKAIRALRFDLPAPQELKPTVRERKVSENGAVTYEDTGLVRVGANKLPAELEFLVSIGGIKCSAIYKLMALAKASGQRLSDVVEGVKETIASMRGGRLFAYLMAACKGYRNFSQEKEIAKKDMEEQAKLRLELERSSQEERRKAQEIAEQSRQKSELIGSLNNDHLDRLRKIWLETKGKTENLMDRAGELLFKGWLRGKTKEFLLGDCG